MTKRLTAIEATALNDDCEYLIYLDGMNAAFGTGGFESITSLRRTLDQRSTVEIDGAFYAAGVDGEREWRPTILNLDRIVAIVDLRKREE